MGEPDGAMKTAIARVSWQSFVILQKCWIWSDVTII